VRPRTEASAALCSGDPAVRDACPDDPDCAFSAGNILAVGTVPTACTPAQRWARPVGGT